MSRDALEAILDATFEGAAVFTWDTLLATGLAILIGGVTFTGSLVAFGKLQGLRFIPGRPIQFVGQKVLIAIGMIVCLALTGVLITEPQADWTVVVIGAISLVLGILLVIGIGGADMPVVISLLNSYSGLAASMAGFVLNNHALIITGALVGASGIILTNIMCKAMNRSLANVLFGGVGGAPKGGGATATAEGTVRELTVEDAAIQIEASQLVIVVPGYGMAVAQAQHSVAELAEQLESRGITVKYAIHPVAGRMPGHMNVLLAEANVPYEQLCDLDTINPDFEQAGVALVIGANDVTNPAARHDTASPIYGMPILDVDKANSVIVIKRSLNPGFAGVENELYYMPNCGMLFGDGKAMVNALVNELKES
ncbi:MAG: NAD synthetase [Phycisphaerae bacterium]|nr:NAD synthetase [Phycisphaerae bacterium]